ncbi:uncharacterized protein [Palaemon carinicauda]|uniref:uncharacterized protein n=1 Tax=Palaemon carinicauda TaxID=392227 RepID=UPI0035B5AAF8
MKCIWIFMCILQMATSSYFEREGCRVQESLNTTVNSKSYSLNLWFPLQQNFEVLLPDQCLWKKGRLLKFPQELSDLKGWVSMELLLYPQLELRHSSNSSIQLLSDKVKLKELSSQHLIIRNVFTFRNCPREGEPVWQISKGKRLSMQVEPNVKVSVILKGADKCKLEFKTSPPSIWFNINGKRFSNHSMPSYFETDASTRFEIIFVRGGEVDSAMMYLRSNCTHLISFEKKNQTPEMSLVKQWHSCPWYLAAVMMAALLLSLMCNIASACNRRKKSSASTNEGKPESIAREAKAKVPLLPPKNPRFPSTNTGTNLMNTSHSRPNAGGVVPEPSRPDSDIYVKANNVRLSMVAYLKSKNVIRGNVYLKEGQ